jgi:hypothetical protein
MREYEDPLDDPLVQAEIAEMHKAREAAAKANAYLKECQAKVWVLLTPDSLCVVS